MTGASHSPVGSVDRSVLLAIEGRLKTATYVDETYVAIEHGKPTLTATVSPQCFSPTVEEAYYQIRWYTSDDFEVHYQENWTDQREWKRRWDRHPREGSRDHYHPPPDAGRPPEPASFPDSYYEVMSLIERETIDHLRQHPLLDGES